MNASLRKAVAALERARMEFCAPHVRYELEVQDTIEQGIAGKSHVPSFDSYCRRMLVMARYVINRCR